MDESPRTSKALVQIQNSSQKAIHHSPLQTASLILKILLSYTVTMFAARQVFSKGFAQRRAFSASASQVGSNFL
jgi:hypothetical protein